MLFLSLSKLFAYITIIANMAIDYKLIEKRHNYNQAGRTRTPGEGSLPSKSGSMPVRRRSQE